MTGRRPRLLLATSFCSVGAASAQAIAVEGPKGVTPRG